MANLFFPRGEFIPPEQVLDQDIASGLGSRILGLSAQYRSRLAYRPRGGFAMGVVLEPSETTALVATPGNRVVLSEADFAIVEHCRGVFQSRLPEQGRGLKYLDTDFFIGCAADGRWHVDHVEDVRAVINLSATAITTHVATEWDRTEYAMADSKYDDFAYATAAEPSEPTQSISATYMPGWGIGFNNVARLDRQVPHKAQPSPNRVVMRLFAR